MFNIRKYQKQDDTYIIDFLHQCLPQSGRVLDLDGHHKIYRDIPASFENFWCMFDDKKIIGTAAVKKLDDTACELKALYLFKQYHGRGMGYQLLQRAIQEAGKSGYTRMYLDTLSTSDRAIALYKRAGFRETERYNDNDAADVFMSLDMSRENNSDSYSK